VRILRRLHATLDRVDATIDRNTQAFEDLQVVIRESRIREERAFQGLERAFARHDAALEDMRADIRANTEAILRLLDRWGEGPAAAS
jgi:hypothetical protein